MLLIATLVALTAPNFAELQKRKTTEPIVHMFDRRGRTRKHTFRVRIEIRKFDPKLHKITWDADRRYITRIDGESPFALSIPQTRVSRFQAWIDNKPLRVPRSLWSDCYNLNVRTADYADTDWYKFLLSRDGSRITLKLSGGDGMAGYEMTWTLRRSGKSTRKPSFS